MFENKGEGAVKDYVGINLLLALTLYNVTYSHKQIMGNESDSDNEGNDFRKEIESNTTNITEDL